MGDHSSSPDSVMTGQKTLDKSFISFLFFSLTNMVLWMISFFLTPSQIGNYTFHCKIVLCITSHKSTAPANKTVTVYSMYWVLKFYYMTSKADEHKLWRCETRNKSQSSERGYGFIWILANENSTFTSTWIWIWLQQGHKMCK